MKHFTVQHFSKWMQIFFISRNSCSTVVTNIWDPHFQVCSGSIGSIGSIIRANQLWWSKWGTGRIFLTWGEDICTSSLPANCAMILTSHLYAWFSDEGIAGSVPNRQIVQTMLVCSPAVFTVMELGHSMPAGLSTPGNSWTCTIY